MGQDCDARILLGGKMYDYMGDEPGIGAEARESLMKGSIVLPLGGFGGASSDVAKQLGLWSRQDMRDRKTPPVGPGYDKAMQDIARQREQLYGRLGGSIDQARKLASTSDVKEAARLIVEILEALPKRA
jgi:hypothetical protein